MIEFLLENLFSIVADMSVEKIRQLRDQYTNQNILYMTICQYVNTDWFRTEHSDVTAALRKDKVLAIGSDDISPAKTVDEIADSIREVLGEMLVTDETSAKQNIITAIAAQYRSKSGLAIGLFDILEKQSRDTEEIIGRIEGVDKKTLLIADSVLKREALRERAIKSGIGMKMGQFINNTAQNYISIVTKEPPQTSNPSGDFNQYMGSVRKLIKSDFPNITADFFKKPVQIMMLDPNGSLMPVFKDVETLQFLDLFSRQVHAHIDELLKYTNLLPDEFILEMIELGHLIDSDMTTQAAKMGAAQLLRKSAWANAEESVKGLKSYYRRLGEKILAMETYTKWR